VGKTRQHEEVFEDRHDKAGFKELVDSRLAAFYPVAASTQDEQAIGDVTNRGFTTAKTSLMSCGLLAIC